MPRQLYGIRLGPGDGHVTRHSILFLHAFFKSCIASFLVNLKLLLPNYASTCLSTVPPTCRRQRLRSCESWSRVSTTGTMRKLCCCKYWLIKEFSTVTLKVLTKTLSQPKVGQRGEFRTLFVTLCNDDELRVRLVAWSPAAENLFAQFEESAVRNTGESLCSNITFSWCASAGSKCPRRTARRARSQWVR